MSRQTFDFFERFYRILHKYESNTKQPKQYGTKHVLTSTQVHMIEVIGEQEAITATKLATLLGITKGAVSQTTAKLLRMQLIQKTLSPQGNNEVLIQLSDTGKIIFLHHQQYHQHMIDELSKLAQQLPSESRVIINQMLDTIEVSLDEYQVI